ncbi:MAG: septum site-determining protein MinC [Hormoscilla sp.]
MAMNNEADAQKQLIITNAEEESEAVASPEETKESAAKVEAEDQKTVELKDASQSPSAPESLPKQTESGEKVTDPDRHLQVRLKAAGDRIMLILPPEREFGGTWNELWQQLQLRLQGVVRFWQPQTQVDLMARERLLDGRQLQAIADALSAVDLQLKRVETSRRQTAVAAATSGYSVEQISPDRHLQQAAEIEPLAEPLYLKTTVRSGVEIRHPGSVVILGDINPGGTVICQGDILVWGRLRGVAHAGASGNSNCVIMALQMEPTQLRIANYLARAPQDPPAQYYPEVAYATAEGIRIARATDFTKKPTDEQPRKES